MYIWVEVEVFRLQYEITPATEPHPPGEASPDAWAAWEERNDWGLTGRDDAGTGYEAPSGSFGPSPDGSKTEGGLDIYPLPAPDAAWLDLTFHGGGGADCSDHHHYTLRVILPLPTLTNEDIAMRKGADGAEWLVLAERVRLHRKEMEGRTRPGD